MTSHVGKSCAVEALANSPAKTPTPELRSLFHMTDALLETAIAVAHTRVVTAVTQAECHEACRELEELVGQRSIGQVRWMERLKGLR